MNTPFPFLANDAENLRPCDEILIESEDFVVVPTVGALVPGWLLIVPKSPAICIGAMEISLLDQLEDVKSRCVSIIEQLFGPAAVFEHGPATVGESVGCTVDYAHLHVLPAPCELINSVGNVSDIVPEWHQVTGFAATKDYFNAGMSYLYVEQPVGHASIANAVGTPSQLFRRVVARAIGREVEFNWREHAFIENILSTKSILSSVLERGEQHNRVSAFAIA